MDKRAFQPNIVSRTTRTAVAAMLASTMCIPSPALAQESRSDNSPASELQEPSNEETLGDKPDSTLAAANDSPSLQATEAAVEDAPMALSAGEDAESTLTYSIDEDGNATITGTTDEKTKRGIVIPESIDGHPVTAIAEYAFSGKTPQSDYDLSDRTDLWLTSFYIPNSVKSIGGFAFKNNKNLESVHLPENGCIIGHKDRWDAYGSIFSEYISLKTITIPNGLDIIDGTYRGTCISALSAPNLENVIFSKGTSAICRGILANCPSLKSVDIPDSVKSIGAYAFDGCEALESIDIPDSVKSIDAYAFSGCASLESVRLPKDGCEIGNNGLYGNYAPIFTGCDSLKHITIPDGLTTSDDHNSPRGPLPHRLSKASRSLAMSQQLTTASWRTALPSSRSISPTPSNRSAPTLSAAAKHSNQCACQMAVARSEAPSTTTTTDCNSMATSFRAAHRSRTYTSPKASPRFQTKAVTPGATRCFPRRPSKASHSRTASTL